jgi:hypothetical protein
MHTRLTAEAIEAVFARLEAADRGFAARYPGESGRRQPVHTVYGGAHLFTADTAPRLGAAALRALEQYGGDPVVFARAIGLPGADRIPELPERFARRQAELQAEAARHDAPGESPASLAHTIYTRVLDKLRREPVEDFRIDFEDGYGNRTDAEEDGHAAAAGEAVARGLADGTLPPFIGIRLKPLSPDLRGRSARTLDIFVGAVLARTGGRLPPHFVVTLPKVTMPEQVSCLAELLARLEQGHRLPDGTLRLELMIETTPAIIDAEGACPLPRLVQAGGGRWVAAHFGTYDYTAACSITAAHQHMRHPACDFARHVMQVALAGTGIWLSDGATNVLPVGPHRTGPQGPPLTDPQMEENRATVHAAWKLHFDHVQHSLVRGYYQGWDLHPAQLPTRYASVYTFFLTSLDRTASRLRNFVGTAARATLAGDVFDDAATGQGLLNHFLRAVNCGALGEPEALELTGLTLDELRGRSFVKILEARRGR